MTSVTRILRANVHDDDTPASTSSRNNASVIDATGVRIHTRDASQACYTQSVVKSDEIWQLPKEHCTKKKPRKMDASDKFYVERARDHRKNTLTLEEKGTGKCDLLR